MMLASSPKSHTASPPVLQRPELMRTLLAFSAWLERFGEVSQDHQDFFASRVGRAAKELYYRRPLLGKFAVLPMVACEAFAPWTRRFYFPRMRLPISDAHFAMAFTHLYGLTGETGYLDRARHFLDVLEQTRCSGYGDRWGWGYPFDWQTKGGILAKGTPLITTTPYCYEAFSDMHGVDPNPKWRKAMRAIAEHCLLDYRDVVVAPGVATCTYTPTSGEKVVNASAYRAYTLIRSTHELGDQRYRAAAEPNLRFVLQCQLEDGSWPYAVDGKRPFVDHFHTCFVMKALAKIEAITGDTACTKALDLGVAYYLKNLFDLDGLPKPFARAPRLTVYKRELYDCAECINLGVLLRGRYPDLDRAVDRTVNELITRWQLPQGSFRSRKLLIGWDNVPMHRWGQSEVFRALVLYSKAAGARLGTDSVPTK